MAQQVDLGIIFTKQIELDQHIQSNHNVTYDIIFEKLKLALAVELGELANEVRCFKFWSFKARSPKNVVLEEYVDGIHFITSLCLAKKIPGNKFQIKQTTPVVDKDQLTKMFNDLYKGLNKLNTKKGIIAWYEAYLNLGIALGFSLNEIIQAYLDKNNINHQRQNTNY